MFVKPFSSRADPSGNGVQRELIVVNSTLTLCPVRLIRNRSIRLVHVFHSPGEPSWGRRRFCPTGRPAPNARAT
jgi:hypothetical protein